MALSTVNYVTIACTILLSGWTSHGYGQVRLLVAGILAPCLRYLVNPQVRYTRWYIS